MLANSVCELITIASFTIHLIWKQLQISFMKKPTENETIDICQGHP